MWALIHNNVVIEISDKQKHVAFPLKWVPIPDSMTVSDGYHWDGTTFHIPSQEGTLTKKDVSNDIRNIVSLHDNLLQSLVQYNLGKIDATALSAEFDIYQQKISSQNKKTDGKSSK